MVHIRRIGWCTIGALTCSYAHVSVMTQRCPVFVTNMLAGSQLRVGRPEGLRIICVALRHPNIALDQKYIACIVCLEGGEGEFMQM